MWFHLCNLRKQKLICSERRPDQWLFGDWGGDCGEEQDQGITKGHKKLVGNLGIISIIMD